jgi:four helix bundle protein
VTSVPANLAEFAALEHSGSKLEKLNRCIAENNETEVWLDLCKVQRIISEDQHKGLVEKNTIVRKRLYCLREAVKEASVKNRR